MSSTVHFQMLKDRILELIDTGEYRRYSDIKTALESIGIISSSANIARAMQEVAVKDEFGVYRIKVEPHIQLSCNLLAALHAKRYFYALEYNDCKNTIITSYGMEALISGLFSIICGDQIYGVVPGQRVIEVISTSEEFTQSIHKTYCLE